MKKALAVAAIAALCATASVWSQEAPKPGPQHKKMEYFAGVWEFSGEAKASPMGPAGPITFTETCEMFEGGFALVCRSTGKSPMGPTKSLSLMSYDAGKGEYTYAAVESGSPAFIAIGHVDGPTWNWKTETKMGDKMIMTKVTIKELPPGGYEFSMAMGEGSTVAPIVHGKATRKGT